VIVLRPDRTAYRRRSRSVQAIAAAWAVAAARAALIVMAVLLLVAVLLGPPSSVAAIAACVLACALVVWAACVGWLPTGDYDEPEDAERPTTVLPPIDLPDRYR
jgi:fatty acid desaturase